jgi:tRNA A37 threonylcarbamoyladenosine dehydratase
MQDAFSRMELLVGNAGEKKISRAKIAVFGLGGAGSYATDALARCGVGSLTLVDHAKITLPNVSSQILAVHSTIGMSKVEAAKKRIHDIDENILVHTYETFYNEETAGMFDLHAFDYVVDAMGTLSSKLLLISRAKEARVPVISCLDMGNKLDPSRLEITDISRTAVCPVAKAVKMELRKRGIRKLKVLYSKERPVKERIFRRKRNNVPAKPVEGNISFVLGTAGCFLAGEVVRDILSTGMNVRNG